MGTTSIDAPATVWLRLRAVLDHSLELTEPRTWDIGSGESLHLRRVNEDDQRWTSDEPKNAEFYSFLAPVRQHQFVVVLSKQWTAPRRVAAALHEMANNQRPTGSAPLDERDVTTYRETAGRHVRRDDYIGWSTPTPHHDLPPETGQELGKAFDAMQEALFRAWRVIRWRWGLRGKVSPLGIFGFEVSFDETNWTHLSIPDHERSYLRAAQPLRFNEDIDAEVVRLLREGTDEPTAAQMLVEALSTVDETPQSALLVGIAAVETAAKTFIAQKCPAVERFVMGIPSPPLLKVLTEAIPQVLSNTASPSDLIIPASRSREGYSDPVLRALEKGVQMRNEVSHRGARVDAEKVRSVLLAASDVLYLLEYYAGSPWASQRIRAETREAWRV